MARRKKGLKIDGWLVIDKPLEMTSSQVVGKVRYLTKAQKAGHGGTLDPLATGILPIGLGEATKTMPFIVDASKTYQFTLQWGSATTTDDSEGEITETSAIFPSQAAIENQLQAFTGTIMQRPPAYSAIKVDGKRAYALARSGETVELKERPVIIHGFKMTSYDEAARQTTFEVDCGKGTYIRSLGRDLAATMGSCGHVVMLRRTRVGPFDEKSAISLEKLADLSHSAPAADYVASVLTALDDIPVLALTEAEAGLIKQGRQLPADVAKQGTVVVTSEGVPVAIAQYADGMIRPLRVFNM